jgi:hypothetical protein
MDWWIAKHNRYAALSALANQQFRELRDAEGRIKPRLLGGPAERRRFLKERVWPYMPAKGILFFLYLYIFRLGFLDGRKGLMFCSMHGVFQQMKVAKEWELRELHNLRPVLSEIAQVPRANSETETATAERHTR